ncbi:MAG TPA: BlaI/MecI/CopY family transcriptional regulator [Gemmataceae bacterium]|jgi:predicted transcriptional regulator|nr:BlaI/MecI/CopY family transcriptional regulator [Gemmataceae bacterium]
MARPKSTQPTDGELEILKLLWEAGPCTLGPICTDLRRNRPVATTTVATMLTVMLTKGLVTRNSGRRGYLWSAKVGREATTRRLVDRLLDRAFDGSARLLVAHLVDSKKLSIKDRQKVLELLERGTAKSRQGEAPDL